MSFFEDFPEPQQIEPPPRPKRQPWMGAPAGWIGGWVPWHIELFKTEKLYAVIGGVYAFPTGVSFEGQLEASDLMRMGIIGIGSGLRIGIGFSDGCKADTAAARGRGLNDDPVEPVLEFGSLGGAGLGHRVSLWLWPLPPPGPLTIAAVWPDAGVSERIITLDAEELIEAADRAEKLWGVDPNDW
jgi:hypothetical protein